MAAEGWRRRASTCMRVLQVIARLNVGGTARYVGRLATDLPQHGIETLVATGRVQGAEQEDPIVETIPVARIEHLGRALSPRNDVAARAELRALIAEYRPDVIHTHTFKAGLVGRSLPHRAPLVHTFHGHLFDDPDFSGPKAHVIAAIERALAPRADALVTVGERVASDLLQRHIGVPMQYSSIAPGVDPLALPDRADARTHLELPADAVVVAWLARVTAVKAPLRVVALARAFPDSVFVMGGGGDMLEQIREQAPSNLRVLGWADAAAVYAAADIALSTSTNEGMPVSLIEAQLAGLPVVATDVGGVSEVVRDSVTGLVVEPAGLHEALGRLLNDSTLRRAYGEAAALRARTMFSPEHMVRQHAELYRRLARQ